jgi:hypothetical protein
LARLLNEFREEKEPQEEVMHFHIWFCWFPRLYSMYLSDGGIISCFLKTLIEKRWGDISLARHR